jgi:hypothetical protein
MHYLRLPDDEFLKDVDRHTGHTSGPGGQHRNKTSSALRMMHRPTGVMATADDSRLQGKNREICLARLRHAIAVRVRTPVDLEAYVVPEEVRAQIDRKGKLRVSLENPSHPLIISAVLDLLDACAGRVADAAGHLGITTTNLVNLLHKDPAAWTAAQGIRAQHGLSTLKDN